MTPAEQQRITKVHLERSALIYVRQSSPEQVRDNVESTQVQRGLCSKAIALGWHNPIVIEDDLGVTASGFAHRPGFQRMLTDVTMRKVGIILCVDASRLSRNSKDWAHLFELCGYFNTLVADLQQVYDVSVPNDRLVLQIRGTIAEMELSTIRMRLSTGLEAKAARGELKFILPSGYEHDSEDRIVQDPDKRVQKAIYSMFERFEGSTSIRQLVLWYQDTQTLLPVRKLQKTGPITWEVPTHTTLTKMLEHPIYAGAYVYGRRNVFIDCVKGQLVKRRGKALPLEQCRVFIKDHHEPYISWEQYQTNLAKIAEARPRWSMQENRGAIREGFALLSGLLRCGQCGRKLYVSYRKDRAIYYCDGSKTRGSRRCLSFGSKLVDELVSKELCRVIEPMAIEASEKAFEHHRREREQILQQAELQVQALQYEAHRALEQYDLVDPKNRLVADTLEERLNERLAALHSAKKQLDEKQNSHPTLTMEQRRDLKDLARDFGSVWNHPGMNVKLRKQLVRTALDEVIVSHKPDKQELEIILHWQGGAHTRLCAKKRGTTVGSKTDDSLKKLLGKLADAHGDADIARVFNMKKITTPRGFPWTQDRVRDFRWSHGIRLGRKNNDPNILSGEQTARYLGISKSGVRGLVRRGILNANQITEYAPWQILRDQLDSEIVRSAVQTLKATGRIPDRTTLAANQMSLLPNQQQPKGTL